MLRILLIFFFFFFPTQNHTSSISHTKTKPTGPPDSVFLDIIPKRKVNALGGHAFLQSLVCLKEKEREKKILTELKNGNVPAHLRTLMPINVPIGQKDENILIYVMPDYLSIGSKTDFVRIPLNFYTATEIATTWDLYLPTTKIVDHIYEQADCKLKPITLPPSSKMTTIEYFAKHESLIASAEPKGRIKEKIVAGHKKDIILSNKLLKKKNRIAIYGWHRNKDQVIQPSSTVHRAGYADYSHGLRLILGKAWANGKWVSLSSILANEKLSRSFSNEGVMDPKKILPHCQVL